MRTLTIGLTLLFSLGWLLGCERPKESDLSDFQKVLEDGYDGAKKHVDYLTTQGKGMSEKASKEFEKIFVFEYKVATFPFDTSHQAMEAGLNQLGKERWECFSAMTVGNDLRLTCKRRPETVLKYLPYLPKFLW